MRHNKIKNLLGIKIDPKELPKFSPIKWIEIFDQSNGSYNPNKDIRFKTSQLRNNDLCDFSDACIAVTTKISATNPGNDNNVDNRKLALRNLAPFFNCILKINNQLIKHADDLHVVMPMCNLLYYFKNFKKLQDHFGIIILTYQI